MDFGGSWNKKLSLVEFSYNNSHQASLGMAPFEALYGRKCRSPVHWYEIGQTSLDQTDFTRGTTEAVKMIRQRLETAQSRQKSYANKRRRPLEIQVGDAVFFLK